MKISLIDTIRSLFESPAGSTANPGETEGGPRADPRQVAACALLLEIAHADGVFSEAEREHLEGVLASHFDLDPAAVHELLRLAEAERGTSIDHHRFTSLLRSSYDLDQKMMLAESMWGLVLADGEIADHEHYLTRKIANLLDLQPAQLSAASASSIARSAMDAPPSPQKFRFVRSRDLQRTRYPVPPLAHRSKGDRVQIDYRFAVRAERMDVRRAMVVGVDDDA